MEKVILLTVIADESLTSVIEEFILESGGKGFTLCRVEGRGKTGMRDNQWVGENVKIETIAPMPVVTKILEKIQKQLFEKYPVIAYSHDVNVVRTDHF